MVQPNETRVKFIRDARRGCLELACHTAHVCGGLLRLHQEIARNQGLKAPVTRVLVLTESSRTRSSKNNNTAVEYSNPIHEQPRLVL
jgi:hypothetical protein